MPVYFVSTNYDRERSSRVEASIRDLIPELASIASLENIPQDHLDDPSDPAYVIFAAPTGDSAYLNRLIDVVSRNRHNLFFVLVSDDIPANDYKRLVRTGHADCVSVARAAPEIVEIIARRRDRLAAARSSGAQPVVIALVPSAGGVGNATIAVEIGVKLKTEKATRDRRICLIDLDFQSSHVCQYLDTEPRLQIQEIVDNPERLDEHLFEIFKTEHRSGLDLFACPRQRLHVTELKVAALDAIFNMIATRYDLVLVDLPPTWFSWTIDLVANCDAVLVTGLNTIPGLHQMAETVSTLRSLRLEADPARKSEPVPVIVNRSERRMTGGYVRSKHVEQVLGSEKVFYVSADVTKTVDSVNTGVPLTTRYPNSRVAKELAEIAEYCAAVQSRHLMQKVR
jgi:pilus assembly protein CpaE